MSKTIFILFLCLFLRIFDGYSEPNDSIPEDVWIGMDMGAGGYLNGCQAGPTGIMLLISDLSGAYISKDRGQSWKNIGYEQGIENTHASTMGFDPVDSNVMFIGVGGGIYKSKDEGSTFYESLDSMFCTEICISKNNHQIGYAGGNSKWNVADGSLYQTTNNGDNWTKLSTNLPTEDFMIHKIVISNNDPNKLYLLSHSGRFAEADKALFFSKDGGSNWIEINPALLHGEINDFAVDPVNEDIIYASRNGNNTDVLKSIDGGENWKIVINKNTGLLVVKPDMPNVVRCISSWRLIESSDYGENWIFHPAWPSSDYLPGRRWVNTSRKCEDLSDSDTYFWTNSCWIFASFNGGKNYKQLWTTEMPDNTGWWITRGVENTVPWDIEISQANSDIIYIGFYDMGMWRSLDHGKSWQSCNNTDLTGTWVWSVDDNSKQGVGGNTRTICADPDRENVVWATIQGNQKQKAYLCKSTDYGKFDSWITSEGLPDATDIMGLSIDYNSSPSNRTLLVTVEGNIYKSDNDGADWRLLVKDLNCKYTLIDNHNSDYMYAGGDDGLYRSVDKGENWEKIGLPEMTFIHDIKFDPVSSGTIYAVCFGEGKGLYKSNNYGVNWSKVLTDDFLRGVAIDPLNTMNIYAGSSSAKAAGGYKDGSNGFLCSRDQGATWNKANEGLSWPFVSRIEIDPENPAYVFIGANGMGFKKRYFNSLNNASTSIKSKINLYSEYKTIVYPNPAGDQLTIILDPVFKKEQIFMTCMDVNCSLLIRKVLRYEDKIVLSMAGFNSGIYFLSIQTNDHNELVRFVKK
jgi:photosystem II stability/assembly factor-like uncharacterized protein